VTNDLTLSILGYAGLICITTIELLFVGRMMRGRGRMVLLTAIVFLLGLVGQFVLLNEDAPICAFGWCWHPMVVSVQRWLSDWPSPVLWLGKFTDFTLVNVFVLICGPMIVLLAAWASRALYASTPTNDAEDRRDRLRRLLIGRSTVWLYGDLFGSAVIIGGIIVWLAASNLHGAAGRDLVADLAKTVWAVPILGFGLLWRASHAVAPEDSAVRASPALAAATPRQIVDLFNSYLQAYRNFLMLGDAVLPAAPTVSATPPDLTTMIGRAIAAAQLQGYRQLDDMHQTLKTALGQFWKEQQGDTLKLCPIFEESLTFLHFILFAEIILSCQDRGGCTLLLAPKASLGRIERELRRALSVHFAGYTQQIWDGHSEPHGLYDVLIVSPEEIEANLLSRDNGSLRDALERLGLVMILDYQNIDASLLRIRLARLRRLTSNRALQVVCQSEPRAGLQSKVANTISVLVPVTPERVEIGGGGSAQRFWLFWRNDGATLRQLHLNELSRDINPAQPLEVLPLTLSRAMKQDYRAIYFDPYGRAHRASWLQALAGLHVAQQLQGVMNAEWAMYPGDGDRVVVIEDLANLISAARKNLNFMHNADCLTHVVSHNYPMREFLLKVLQQEIKGAADNRGVWSHLGTEYLPIAPNPTGGPTELAIDLATEFMRTGKVKQRDIEARFREVLRDGVAESLEIAPTMHGLTKLFEHQREITPDIRVTETLGHERVFEIEIAARALLEPRFLLPVKLGGTTIHHVDQQDEGLTYYEGTLLQVDRDFVQVQQVFNTHVLVQHAQFPGAYRPAYLFARRYMVNFDPQLMFVEDEDVPQAAAGSPVEQLRFLLRGSYARRTVALATVNEISFDLPPWRSINVEKASPNASIMLARFVLARTHPQVTKLTADDFSRLAFTLAATLQDTLRCFFPSLTSILAVLSPEAGPSIETFIEQQQNSEVDEIDLIPFNLYPRLVGEHFEPPLPEGATSSDTERRTFEHLTEGPAPVKMVRTLIDRYIGTAQLNPPVPTRLLTTEPNRVIDLIVVEDASHDRGAVRALFEESNWTNVVKVWSRFVRWAATQRGTDNFYYQFGRGRVPKVLAFDEAAEFLDSLVRAQTDSAAPNPGPAVGSWAGAAASEHD
jgi:hypothetical protein